MTIFGAGGNNNAGNGDKPKIKKDGLDSSQYAKIIDLISEGEIAGLKNGDKSIYFDNTPLAGVGLNTSYVQTATSIVVSAPNHKRQVEDPVYLEFLSGDAVNGRYIITEKTDNTFTVQSSVSQSTDGLVLWSSYNFQDVESYTTNGTADQPIIPFDNAIEDERSVNITVSESSPVVRTITDVNVDAVRVTITFPALQRVQDGDGDVVGDKVNLEIYVQYAGGGFSRVLEDEIKGRSGDQYQKDYEISLTGAKPAEVKVVRVTPDATKSTRQNSFVWSSYTEIIYAKLRYPNTALIGLRVNAEQFSSIPKREYLIRGIKIAIPVNASVNNTTGSLTYNGIWNGTFSAAQWCSDPAWVLWDLLVSKRYGFGDHIDVSQLDKWAFYAASQYCSALNTYSTATEIANRAAIGLPPRTGTTDDYDATTGRHGVPDGFGNYEPRFSCNVNIQAQEDAYKLINDMCSIFRAMPYWSSGALTISQDKPADSVYLFNTANVSTAGFSYSSSSKKTRANVAVVSYLDLEIRDIAYEVVEDADSISRYGAITKEISAFACTSRGQANRIGQWLIYSERYETEVVSFSTSVEAGILVRPGQIIDIADPVKAGQRRGGRIVSAMQSQIVVDSIEGITSGTNTTLSVILPDGNLEVRSIASIQGNTIIVNSPFSVAPNANSVWVYQTEEIQASQWRVLTVQEEDGVSYAITALSHNASKYAYIEEDRSLQPRDTTDLNEIPVAPLSLTLSETLYYYQGQVRAKVIASWPSVSGVNQYQVHWRKDDGNWTVINKLGPDYEILNITPGTFEFKVYSLSAGLKTSADPAIGAIEALGKTAPPSDVTGLTASIDPYIGITLSWNPISDIDFNFYEIRIGATWSSATVLTQLQGTSYKVGYLTSANQTFLIKAVDTSGVYSSNAASFTAASVPPNPATIAYQIQDPTLVLSWSQPAVTNYTIDYYRITFGDVYAVSTEISTTKSTTFSLPINWNGTRKFWVTPVDIVGISAVSPNFVSVSITQAPAPIVEGFLSGASVNLNWSAVNGTLSTRAYQVRAGATFATATILAETANTNYSTNASWIGSQTFWVSAIDGNDNLGAAGFISLTLSSPPAPVISSQFTGREVVLSWSAVEGSLDTDYYIIKRGAAFESAVTVATAYATAYTLRVDWVGQQTFWIAAVDVAGLVGLAGSEDIIVSAPSAPTVTQQVIDNNVLLRWNDVTSTLPIEYYELRKGVAWESSIIIGTKQGRFTTVFENQSGTYTYWLAGVDSAGNYGAPGFINAVVDQPPDYVLQLEQASEWSGSEVNIYTDSLIGQIVNIKTAETWQQHFTSNSYNSPQDQIDAGFAYYLMPTATTASYEEEFDAGALLPGIKISAILTTANVVGSTTIVPSIRTRGTTSTAGTYSQPGTTVITVTSNNHGVVADDLVWLDFTSGAAADGSYVVASATANTFTVNVASPATTSGNVSWIKWTTYSGVSEVVASAFRYFRVRYDFSSVGNNDILVLNSLVVRLDAKIRNDSGTGVANSSDVGGTIVNFNLSFADIQSITLTPSGTTAISAVYDFTDSPNPTSFKVLLFDSSGTRVSGSFSWNARGI